MSIAHETVIHICFVNIPSRDRSARVDSKRVGTLEGTWHITRIGCIECGEGAVLIHQETVTQIVCVKVVSHDRSTRSKAPAEGSLAGARAGSRNIVRRDGAALVTEEAVVRVRRISVESCNLPAQADCECKRPLTGCCACTRRIECGEAAVPISQKTVTH